MGDDKKPKKCGGLMKRFLMMLIVLAVGAYAGWFAYAKATNQPDC